MLFPLHGLVYTPASSLPTWQAPSYPSGWLKSHSFQEALHDHPVQTLQPHSLPTLLGSIMFFPFTVLITGYSNIFVSLLVRYSSPPLIQSISTD